MIIICLLSTWFDLVNMRRWRNEAFVSISCAFDWLLEFDKNLNSTNMLYDMQQSVISGLTAINLVVYIGENWLESIICIKSRGILRSVYCFHLFLASSSDGAAVQVWTNHLLKKKKKKKQCMHTMSIEEPYNFKMMGWGTVFYVLVKPAFEDKRVFFLFFLHVGDVFSSLQLSA